MIETIRFFIQKAVTATQVHTIAKKILVSILIFSSVATLFVTIFQLYSYYNEQTEMVEQRMGQIERSYRDSLANAIWYFNAEQIDNILLGFLKFEDVHFVSVVTKTGGLYQHGEKRVDGGVLKYVVDVSYNANNRPTLVGQLSIESNLEGVVHRLGHKFWEILISQALKTFFVSAFILFAIHYLVTRHLSAIANFAVSLDLKQKNEFLKLDRPEGTTQDELDKISTAMNQMKNKLIADAVLQEQARLGLKKLSQVVEQSAVSVMILDADERIEYVNPAFEKSTGLCADEVVGNRSDEMCFGEKTAEDFQEIWKKLRSGDVWHGEIQTRRENTPDLWERTTVFSIVGPDQKITHFVVQKEDVSALKQAEQDLTQAQKMEAVGHLAGGIAHDFNNLLTIMLGNVDLLSAAVADNDELAQYIDPVLKAGARGASLTHRLLAFSRKQTLLPEATNVGILIDGMQDLLCRSLGETMDLNVSLPATLWAAKVDRHQLENALINLSLNARDAMPSGGKLSIHASNFTCGPKPEQSCCDMADGDYVKIEVVDEGFGMSAEVLTSVFEPFFTTKKVGEGSGLGLSMVYGFAQQSNGHVCIESKPHLGTTIKLYLPRSTSEALKAGVAGVKTNDIQTNHRILVVEDDADLRRVPVAILSKQGYEVIAAADGQEALAHLSKETAFDMLFTDVVLPKGMNGVEVAAEAKKLQPGIKVLYTTGYAESAVIQLGGAEGGLNMIKKPYRATELLKIVELTLKS